MTWVPFDLHPEIPPEGVSAARIYGHRRDEVEARFRELLEPTGLPFSLPERIPRTRDALEVAEWVRRQDPDVFDAVHRALFVAYWGEGRDIGDRDVVLEIVAQAGADADGAAAALAARETADAVDAWRNTALDAGVSGTPAWLFDGDFLVPGCQPRELFDRVVTRLRARNDDRTA